MNLRNRLKTIEKTMNVSNSEFCDCYGIALKSEVLPITIDEWKRRVDSGEETITRLPDVCADCRKPIDKRFIETTFEQVKENNRKVMEQIMNTMSKFED